MDYIREELLRQQAALARLLQGGGSQSAEAAGEDFPAAPAESGGEAADQTAGVGAACTPEGGLPAGRREMGLRLPTPGRGGSPRLPGENDAAGRPETAAGGGEELRRFAGAAAVSGAAGVWNSRGTAAEGYAPPGLAGLGQGPETAGRKRTGRRPEAAWEYTAEVWRAEDRGTLDAEALSRTFQRDARRYDGGFSLY